MSDRLSVGFIWCIPGERDFLCESWDRTASRGVSLRERVSEKESEEANGRCIAREVAVTGGYTDVGVGIKMACAASVLSPLSSAHGDESIAPGKLFGAGVLSRQTTGKAIILSITID